MTLKPGLFLFLILLVPTYSPAQAWSGILDPSRATDWTQAGIRGGIPNRTTVCQTVAPSGDQTGATDAANIGGALANCAGKDQVVLLGAGTYWVSGLLFDSLNQYNVPSPFDDVTLRGAGPDKTKLMFTHTIPCFAHADVCLEGTSGPANSLAGTTTWTAGYTKGSDTLTLGSTSRLHVGQVITLDQRDDAIGICPASGGTGACTGVSGATESGNIVTITTSIPHGYRAGQSVGIGCVGSTPQTCNVTSSGYNGVHPITATPTSTTFQYIDPHFGLAASGGGQATVDTGGVYLSCVGGPTCSDESGSGVPGIGRSCPDPADPSCATGEISYREQQELKQITAINGNQITVNPPLEMPNWRSSQAPGVYWNGNKITGTGIEDMTLDYSNDGALASGYTTGGIVLTNAYECWVKNVRSIAGNRNHIWIIDSARIDVEDSYFWGSKRGASQSYGVEVFNGNSDNLIQNNICQHVPACLLPSGDWGSVYAYNYMVDGGNHATAVLDGMLSGNHDFAGYDLFEGNDSGSIDIDDIHGDSTAQTVFRSRLVGQNTPRAANYLIAAIDSAFNRFANFVGNVLGTTGAESSYQAEAFFPSGYVWDVGAEDDNGGTPNDPLTVSSLLRWGNFNASNSATLWNIAEVPASLFTYISGNQAPASQNLPASFYLSTKPAFWTTPWGTPPWPAIGPDVTNGNAPDGNDPGRPDNHSNAIPAQLCYENTGVDPAYQQSYSVTGATWSPSSGGGTATVSFNNGGAHALLAGDTITVSGISSSGASSNFNGIFAVVSASSSSITYALANNPGTYASGGTVSYPNILLFNAANCYPAAYGSGNQPMPPTGLSATVH